MSQRTSEADDVPPVTDTEIEDGAREVARAMWAVILSTRNDHQARGLMGRAKRKKLVESIVRLMRLVRGQRPSRE
jgi:hypothetical protein